MQPLCTHLTSLEQVFEKTPNATAFKVPADDAQQAGSACASWRDVSYQMFRDDVLSQALQWTRTFRAEGIERGSVVTLWLRGIEYADITLMWGLSRAGFIPQLVSFGIPSPQAAYAVAKNSSSALLICDYRLSGKLVDSPLPVKLYHPSEHPAGAQPPPSVSEYTSELPAVDELVRSRGDAAFILLTSGSTSGMPKCVPFTWDWLDTKMPGLDLLLEPQAVNGGQQVIGWLGSACHAGQFCAIIGSIKNGSCMIQPSIVPFSSEELTNMVEKCGMTTLTQFPPHFSVHLKRSRTDPAFLATLQKLDSTVLIGMALEVDDMNWCLKHGITLQPSFGSTESGTVLVGLRARPWLYQPVDPALIHFTPANSDSEKQYQAMEATAAASSQADANNEKLLELIVLSSSRDCPAPHLRSPVTGHYHTGDTFVEVEPGVYESRGRIDDWIRLSSAMLGRCDTRAIERVLLTSCRDLVSDCVVTGSFRPELVVFVEVEADLDGDRDTKVLRAYNEEQLKTEIVRRMEPLQESMYRYEKILHTRQIWIVKKGVLPRTGVKGNIQRTMVEKMFKDGLDVLYGTVSA